MTFNQIDLLATFFFTLLQGISLMKCANITPASSDNVFILSQDYICLI